MIHNVSSYLESIRRSIPFHAQTGTLYPLLKQYYILPLAYTL